MTPDTHRVISPWSIVAALALHGAILYASAHALPEVEAPAAAPIMTLAWVAPSPGPALSAAPAPAAEPPPTPPKAKAPARPQPKSRATARPTPAPPPPQMANAAPAPATPANEATADSVPAADASATAHGSTQSAEAAPFVEPRFDAAYLANPRPAYPPVSRQLGEQGKVILRVLVGADGLPRHVELERSSGYPRLDRAARDAVERWKFVPARRGDTPVEATVLVPIAFSLSSS